MTAPLDGAATSAMALGLSPWILPLIAIAAKRKEDEARHAGRALLAWWRGQNDAQADVRTRQEGATGGRLKARIETVIRPD